MSAVSQAVMLRCGNHFLKTVPPPVCRPKMFVGRKMLRDVRLFSVSGILMEASEFATTEEFFRRFADSYDLLNRQLDRVWVAARLMKSHEWRGIDWSLCDGGKDFDTTGRPTGVILFGRLIAAPKKKRWRTIKALAGLSTKKKK